MYLSSTQQARANQSPAYQVSEFEAATLKMKTSFATRRKARIIGQDDNEANNTSDGDSQKDSK